MIEHSLGPEPKFWLRSGTGSGSAGIWAGTGPVPQFFSERVFKEAKRTDENIYIV